jgi:hypothetical protein
MTPAGLRTAHPQLAPSNSPAPGHPTANIYSAVNLVTFTYSVCTCRNGVKFAHQSLFNPNNSTLLKAMPSSFLKGCPNLLEIQALQQPKVTLRDHAIALKAHKSKLHSLRQCQPLQLYSQHPFCPAHPTIFPPVAVQPYPILHQANNVLCHK